MADFNKAIKVLLDHEGGYVNDPNDPGGTTKYGISLRYLKTLGKFPDFEGDGFIDTDDIQLLSLDDAENIYHQEWWNRLRYNLINNDDLATNILDWSVNIGALRSHKIVQEGLNLVRDNSSQITVDGLLGSETIGALNATNPDRLLIVLRGILASYYVGLAQKNPAMKIYIVGWLAKKAFDDKFPIN